MFEYRLYPVGPEMAFTFVLHDSEGDKLKKAIQFYRDYAATAPDEVSALLASGIVPPHTEVFPESIHGRPFVLFGAMYAGPPAQGERVMQPLRAFGAPLIDCSGVMPYLEVQQVFDADYPNGMRYYWKSLNLTRLDDEVIDRIVEHARLQPSVFSTTDLWHGGGMVARVSPEESAFRGRQVAFVLNPEANWHDPPDNEANVTWVREFINDMQEFSDGGRYLNFAGFQEEGDDMMRKAFGSHYVRLAALKKKYDPTNLFSLNQNIKPGS